MTDNTEVRKTLVQYMALSGYANYNTAGDYLLNNTKFRKKDYIDVVNYYIDKGQMRPMEFSPKNDSCPPVIEHDFLIAVTACASIKEADVVFQYEKIRGKKNSSWARYTKDTYLLVSKALNSYFRMRPELVKEYAAKLDYLVELPSEEEVKEAEKIWNEYSQSLGILDNLDYVQELVTKLLVKDGLFDFLKYFTPRFIAEMVDYCVDGFEELKFMDDRCYEVCLQLLEHIKGSIKNYEYLYNRLVFTESFLKNGHIDEYLSQMRVGTIQHGFLLALKSMQKGDAALAFNTITKMLKDNKSYFFTNSILNYYFALSIYLCDTPVAQKYAETLSHRRVFVNCDSIPVLKFFVEMKCNPVTNFNNWAKRIRVNCCPKMEIALLGMVFKHYGYKFENEKMAFEYAETLRQQDVNVLLLDMTKVYEEWQDKAESVQKATGMRSFLPDIHKKREWEIVMDALVKKCGGVGNDSKKKEVKEEMSRVSYLLDMEYYEVQPKLQKSKNGGATWSKGRNIALSTFQMGIPEMTPQDMRVANLVEKESYGWYDTSYELEGKAVVAALIGHPYVFDMDNPDIRIDIAAEDVQVEVKETSNGFRIVHNVPASKYEYSYIYVIKENAQSLKVIELTSIQVEILTLLDRIKILPKESKEQLVKLLETLGKNIKVVSPLMKDVEGVDTKKGDTKITIQLVPDGEDITAMCYVKPVAGNPPYCTPGKGLEYIATTINGKATQIERDLHKERKNLDEVMTWTESLNEYLDEGGWHLPVVSCLEMLDILRQHQDECFVEWPEGAKFKVLHPMISASSLRMSVKGINNWFECDGEVKIDANTSLKINELLLRIREAKGNFIQLNDDEYVAVSQQLKKQLASISHVMQSERKHLKVAMYNGSFIQDLKSLGVEVEADDRFNDFVRNIEEADSMKITIPKNIQADLRDYQKDGYRWLSRLAHWGAGACLADDMGLGKTLQTITLLLSHADKGASLVIVPTSVLINWRNELNRFAPSLNVIILRNEPDRKAAIDKAGAQDIVLATYGLLPTEENILADKEWNIIVLDEAHNIKNKDTKTSKVAMQLKGKFRLLLTGTPLQNHLGEIWNLFQFATPGLLPSYTQFNQQFINPIEHEQDKERQRLLKRMLSPFILRRTKSEVLDELPEKTEITIKVELSQEERAIYDKFRQDAITNLEEGSTTPIQALAELTRLRQVACNAALVLPKKEAKAIASSKMEAFLKLVDELHVNHHRALVFSQFTSHLALVKEELDKRGIEYNYLDGGTPPSERMKLVDSFQKGTMPLFLISLKAGGTGLNLTAADYVIHLDPWWNPAIEDQASDRAYRIGQDKPVTIYRIIASDTIEDKIIELHQTKKSLADALLEGSDMNHTMGKDEILSLLRER